MTTFPEHGIERTPDEIENYLLDEVSLFGQVYPHEIPVFKKHCKSFEAVDHVMENLTDFPNILAELRQAAKEAGVNVDYVPEVKGEVKSGRKI